MGFAAVRVPRVDRFLPAGWPERLAPFGPIVRIDVHYDVERDCWWHLFEGDLLPEQASGDGAWRFVSFDDMIVYLDARTSGRSHVDAALASLWSAPAAGTP